MSDGNHQPGTMQTMPPTGPPPGGKVSVSPRLRRRAAIPDAGSPQGMPLRRRWGRFAIGAFLALLGGWVSASLYISAGSRVEVVAVSDDVEAYQAIERDDLRIVRVAADPGVDTIDASDIDQIVDRVAATDLVEGSLLTPNQLFREDAELLGENEARVGAVLQAEDGPSDLCRGIDVQIVVSPGGGSEGSIESVSGWIIDVGSTDEDNGERSVDLAVPEDQADQVASASHDGRLSINARESC